MVESEAKELSEEVMLGAVMFGHKSFPSRSSRRSSTSAEVAAKGAVGAAGEVREIRPAFKEQLKAGLVGRARRRFIAENLQGRRGSNRLDAAKKGASPRPSTDPNEQRHSALKLFKDLEKDIVRRRHPEDRQAQSTGVTTKNGAADRQRGRPACRGARMARPSSLAARRRVLVVTTARHRSR